LATKSVLGMALVLHQQLVLALKTRVLDVTLLGRVVAGPLGALKLVDERNHVPRKNNYN